MTALAAKLNCLRCSLRRSGRRASPMGLAARAGMPVVDVRTRVSTCAMSSMISDSSSQSARRARRSATASQSSCGRPCNGGVPCRARASCSSCRVSELSLWGACVPITSSKVSPDSRSESHARTTAGPASARCTVLPSSAVTHARAASQVAKSATVQRARGTETTASTAPNSSTRAKTSASKD